MAELEMPFHREKAHGNGERGSDRSNIVVERGSPAMWIKRFSRCYSIELPMLNVSSFNL